MNHIYLDNAATTSMDKEVKKAMEPYFSDKFGNPGSLHFFGQEARKVIDESREKIAKTVNADFRNIIFTGSATEANNLALRGILKNLKTKSKPKIIISAIEHESILETAKDLEKEGTEVVILPVDKNGFVDLKKLKEFLDERTILVSTMYANNEIGTIQPITEIAKIIRDFRNSKSPNPLLKKGQRESTIQQFNNSTIYPLFHTDAVQAFQFLDCDVEKLGVDLMTLSAHKIYGPKGIGLLYARYIRHKTRDMSLIPCRLSPIITGGGQEFGLRSGTENVPYIVGFAKAIELASKNRAKDFKKIASLKEYFWEKIKKIYPKAELSGVDFLNPNRYPLNHCLPNILNINFSGHLADELLIKLDLAGVAVSSGSACASFSAKPSHVLKALGKSEKAINSSIRFSFGKFTDKKQIDQSLKIIKRIL